MWQQMAKWDSDYTYSQKDRCLLSETVTFFKSQWQTETHRINYWELMYCQGCRPI